MFYADAEAVLAKLPRRGIPMILREILPSRRNPDRSASAKPYSRSGFEKAIQRLRAKLGLPITFTLDASRHGGMTELEEAALTDGQGRALSAHRSQQVVRRLCQANDGTGARSHPQTARASAGERAENDYSEWSSGINSE